MSDASAERQRKRPRTSPKPVSPQSPQSSSSAGSSGEFHAVLVAETSAGRSVPDAVRTVFESVAPDDSPAGRLQHIDIAAPVLAALTASPELAQDLHTVARLCDAVLTLAQDDLDIPLPRQRLDLELSSLDDVAKLIAAARNIVVLTGAGVSVSCGIPDFRSKGGLYDAVLERFGLHDPQAIFDLEEFKMDPSLFYAFAKDVMPSNDLRPSPTHCFIAELERRGKLLRNYSQNIDGLERRAGVPKERVILCHGSFLTATCMRASCGAKIPGSEIAAEVAAGSVPICRKCITPGVAARSEDNENSDDDQEMDASTMGVLKPDIVFFGENLPRNVSDNLENDVSRADLVLVLGTSLQVAPVARIPQYFRDDVPRILVNRELVSYDFDVELLGDCDVVVEELRKVLDWCDEANEAIEDPSSRNAENAVEAALECILTKDGKEGFVNGRGDETLMNTNESKEPVGKFRPPRRFLFPGASQHVRDVETGASVGKESSSIETTGGARGANGDPGGSQVVLSCHAPVSGEKLASKCSSGLLPNEKTSNWDRASNGVLSTIREDCASKDYASHPTEKATECSLTTDRGAIASGDECTNKDDVQPVYEGKGCVLVTDGNALGIGCELTSKRGSVQSPNGKTPSSFKGCNTAVSEGFPGGAEASRHKGN